MIRVTVRAASAVTRAGIEALLASAPDIALVPGAAPAAAADVIVTDRFPDDGADPERGMENVGTANPAVVVLSGPADDGWTSLRAGARAVLPIDATRDEVLAAIHAAAAGLAVMPPDLADFLLDAAPRARPLNATEPLSPREHQILAMLAEGLGNKTIGARLGISRYTVKAHVSSIFAKLGAASRAEAVAIGARTGMIVL